MKTITLLFVLTSTFCFAQNKIISNVMSFENKISEKIYLHFDKEKYTQGETIWFKGYMVSGINLSDKSSILFVDLFDESSKIIQQVKLPIINGIAIGNFETPKEFKNNYYTIKAYTNFMKKAGDNNHYSKKINTISGSVADNKNAQPSVVFSPEGGNIVLGLKNNIAFKSIDALGKPLEISGKIFTEKNIEVVNFKSVHDGMGKFEFIPVAGEKYYAEYSTKDFGIKKIELPIAVENVALLSVENKNKKIFLTIDKSKITNQDLFPYNIVCFYEGKAIFNTKISSDASLFKSVLPLENLPSGILKIVMFNANDKIMAERLVFVNANDFMQSGNYKLENSTLKKNEKNFSFEFDEKTSGVYSVSVLDASAVYDNDIASHFLFTNNLKASVNNAKYYLEKDDEIHTGNLDLVMLTNKLKENNFINNDKITDVVSENNFIKLKGIVFNKNVTNPIINTEFDIIAITKDNSRNELHIRTDNEGKFEVKNLVFLDTMFLSFTKDLKASEDFSVMLDSDENDFKNFSVASDKKIKSGKWLYKNDKKIPTNNIEQRVQYLNAINDDIRSDIVNAQSNSRKTKLDNAYTVTYTVNNGYVTNYRDISSTIPAVNVPIVISKIDNGTVAQNNSLANDNITKTMISTITSQNRAQPINIASISTNSFPAENNNSNSIFTNSFASYLVGFTPIKEFSPIVNKDVLNGTIYWSPSITIKDSKNLSFSFQNPNSNIKKFKIIIEGITEGGKFFHFEKIVE